MSGESMTPLSTELAQMKARLAAKIAAMPDDGIRYRCETCKDTKWRAVVVGGVERTMRCECNAPPKIVFGIPDQFKHVTRESWQPREELSHIGEVADRFLTGTHDLFLFGTVGAGKTLLACILAHALVATGKTAAFRDVPTLLDALRRSDLRTPPDPDETDGLLAVPHRVDLLVLDDVGADKGSDYGRRTLVTLYNARIAESRRTIFTSNLDLETWSVQLNDDRLTSRVAGRAELVELQAPDYRVLGPKEWR